jgi:ABC-type lipoprotein release transport system permease subunit
MNGLTLWRLAWRNLWRNARRSLLTALAIAFGLLCLIVFQALKVGLHQEMIRSTTRLDVGSLQIHAAGYQPNLTDLRPLKDSETATRLLQGRPDLHFSLRLKSPALVSSQAGSASVVLCGVEPKGEAAITVIHQLVTAGSYLAGGDGVLLGAELADSLRVGVGGEVSLVARSLFGRPVSRRFPVAGIFRSASAGFDRSQVFLPLAAAQELLQAQGLVSEIVVRAGEASLPALLQDLQQRLPAAEFQVRDWRQLAPDVVQLIQLNDGTMALLVGIVFAIVALGIANTMTMTVFERFRELGILAAIGTRPAGIVGLILSESLLLGAVAAAVGSLAGWGLCLYLGRYGIDLTRFTSANRYFATSHVLKAYLQPLDLLQANLITLATTLLAGLYPAWRAARLQPAETLRHI